MLCSEGGAVLALLLRAVVAHPWRCLRPRLGPGQPELLGGNWVIFEVSSNLKHSVILWLQLKCALIFFFPSRCWFISPDPKKDSAFCISRHQMLMKDKLAGNMPDCMAAEGMSSVHRNTGPAFVHGRPSVWNAFLRKVLPNLSLK